MFGEGTSEKSGPVSLCPALQGDIFHDYTTVPLGRALGVGAKVFVKCIVL